MGDENAAYLRLWMVRQVLGQAGLLGRRRPAAEGLRRPLDADHPERRWHTDLMTLASARRLHVAGRRFPDAVRQPAPLLYSRHGMTDGVEQTRESAVVLGARAEGTGESSPRNLKR